MWLPPRVRGLLHPEASHDNGRRPYFEGWYVKCVSGDLNGRFALIPGVFRAQDSDSAQTDGAFVQVLDGSTGESWFVSYPESDYWSSPDGFDVQVGPNHFHEGGFTVEIDADSATPLCMHGSISFTTSLVPWPRTIASPGAMGWYAYVPMLECYHGVVSFGHDLRGSVQLNDSRIDLTSGRGYIEKDWGKGFPVGYIWMHSNTFTNPRTSLMGSLAVIPWLTGEFPGLLVGLKSPLTFRRFATYTGASVDHLSIDDKHVELVIKDRKGQLELKAERSRGAVLHAPIRTQMHQRVEETLDAVIHLRLTDAHGEVQLEDTGLVAGLEVHGDVDRLMT